MDYSQIKKVYIIGIEGAGTSALARLLKGMGKDVSGSDDGDHMYYKILQDAGIEVNHSFSKDNLPKDVDLIVYSTANRPETNEELKTAMESKIKVVTYAEALAGVFNQSFGVAVCGSHGKTTTSAWLAYVLKESGKNPSAVIGSIVPQFDGNALVGKSDIIVTENDEYQNKLAYYNPKIILLNNIDYDHPDFFPTREDYTQVFIDFIQKLSKEGKLIANFDDPIIRSIASVNSRGKVISYAINESADYVAYDIKTEGGKQFFKVKLGVDDDETENLISLRLPAEEEGGAERRGNPVVYDKDGDNILGDFSITLSGKHNVLNALAVIAACLELNVELYNIRKYLEEFSGTKRRMEKMGEYHGAKIFDDYAHHPTEIKASLSGVRQLLGDKKITVVFHPHTFTRTKALLDDFASCFDDADEVILLDIYGSAREKQGGVHSRDLLTKIKTHNVNLATHYLPTHNEVEKYLKENIGRGDTVILMGAGDQYKIGESLLK